MSSASLSVPGMPMLRTWGARGAAKSVDHEVGHHGPEPFEQRVPERGQPGRLGGLLGGGQAAARPRATAPATFGGADPELLAAAVDDRLDRLAVPHDERADALGAPILCPEMVSRVGQVVERHRDLAERLHRIAVQQHARGAAPGDFFHRLAHPGLVVHPHHRDRGAPGQGRLERVLVEQAVGIHRQHDLLAAQVGDVMRAAASTALCSTAETAASIGRP